MAVCGALKETTGMETSRDKRRKRKDTKDKLVDITLIRNASVPFTEVKYLFFF